MSTLVQLDIRDDIDAIEGRVNIANDSVVFLVAPNGAKALYNPVHLRMLRYHAQGQGKEIALVTRDRRVQDLARDAGLRVFTSVRSATGVTTTPASDRALLPPPDASERVRSFIQALVPWTVMTLVLSSLVTGAVIFLPHAQISVVPASEAVDEALAVTASSALTFADVAALRVPARAIEVKLTAEGLADGSGTRSDPDKASSGKIVVTNRTSGPIDVPAGTKVSADSGVEFTTSGKITVPPGPDGKAEVDVVAAQSGPIGNVNTRAINRFGAANFDRDLSVFNASPTAGGTTKDGAFVSVDDRANLRQKLLDQLKADGTKQVMAARKTTESIYPETISVRALNESFEEVQPTSPGGKPQVHLKLDGMARALMFDEKAVQQTIVKHLDSRSDGKFTLAVADLKTQLLDAYQWNDEEVSFHIGVQTRVLPSIDKGAIQAAVAGRSVEEAVAVVSKMVPIAGPPTVTLWPFWANKVPRFSWRIGIAFAGIDK